MKKRSQRSPSPVPSRRSDGSSTARDAAAAPFFSTLAGVLEGRAWLGWIAAWLAVTLALAVWRWEIIDSPPYWDSAMGLFVEADFLAETHFDYRRLWTEEKRFTEGGPAVYLSSLLPTLLALGMTYLPTTRSVLICFHVFTFACASAASLCVVAVLRKKLGTPLAVLTATAAMTTPLFSAQVDFLGMDVPSTAAALAAALLATQGRYSAGALAGLTAFFLKSTGGVATAAAVGWLALRLATHERRLPGAEQRRLWLGLSANLFALALEIAVFTRVQEHPRTAVEDASVDPWAGVRILGDLFGWCPDFLLLASIAGGAWFAATALRARRNSQANDGETLPRRALATLQELIRDEPAAIMGFLIVGATVAAFAMLYSIPRYLTLSTPFLWIIAAEPLALLAKRSRGATAALLAVVCAANLINQSGALYPALSAEVVSERRTGAILERSREYLADHRANIAAVQTLERRNDAPILAGAPFVQFLSLPRLGYVAKPLQGYSVNTYTSPTFPPANKMLEDRPKETTLIHVRNRFSDIALPRIPPPETRDFILFDDKASSPLIVYRKEWKPGPSGTPTMDMLRCLWPERGLSQQAETLAKEGRIEEAKSQLLELLREKPHDADARLQLAEILRTQGDLAGAVEQFRRIARLYPDAAAVHTRLGALLEEAGDLGGALEQLQKAVQLEENLAEAQRDLGHVLLRIGRPVDALPRLHRAQQLKADDPKTEFLLGEALVDLGRYDEAANQLDAFLKKNPKTARAHYHRGNIHLLRGEYASAIEHYRATMLEEPRWFEPINNLAWLLAVSPDAKLRNGPEALRLAKAALAGQKENPNAWDTLAAAQAETRDFSQARSSAQQGVELAQKQGNQQLADKIASRLKMYTSNQPYRLGLPSRP